MAESFTADVVPVDIRDFDTHGLEFLRGADWVAQQVDDGNLELEVAKPEVAKARSSAAEEIVNKTRALLFLTICP
jgi:hypothetical protein